MYGFKQDHLYDISGDKHVRPSVRHKFCFRVITKIPIENILVKI